MRNVSTIFESTPTATERSKRDMKYSTGLSRWVLTPLAIWPIANIIGQILSIFLTLLCYFLIFFLIVPCSLHTFINEKDPRLKMKMIGPLSFCLMAISKYSFLVSRKKKIHDCLEHINHDWKQVKTINDREIMLDSAKLGRIVTYFCAGFMYGGGFFYHTIMPLAAGSFTTPDNITIRPLTYPVYDPLFPAQKTPAYEIVFIIQWFSGFVMYSITIGTCSLAAIFALHACGQLKIVMLRLENFVDEKQNIDHGLDDKMAEIIDRHYRTLRFIIRVEEILNEMSGIEFLGCTMNICFLIYYFMSEFERAEMISTITYCVLLISFTFNIYIFCYIGEILKQQGLKVGSTAYQTNWTKLPTKNARGLILIIAMSNNTYSLSAGKMASLSYEGFCGVIKSALYYLNFLRTAVL